MRKQIVALATMAALFMTALTGCGGGKEADTQAKEPATYTYRTYTASLGTKWNPHTWEIADERTILDYLSTGFVSLSIKDSENGEYQWIYEMAESITDVTKENKEDLEKYNVVFQEGMTKDTVEEGYVFEIKLNKDAKWENGTPINADSYITSMKALLDSSMKNYRANSYYSGESAVAGGQEYYYSGTRVWLDNRASGGFTLEDLVKREDGTYATPEGDSVYFASADKLSHLQEDTLKTYVEQYGATYFDVDAYDTLFAKADANGRVAVTDEAIELMTKVITKVADWNETKADCANYIYYEHSYPEVDYDATVGCYKVDDYTIRYVTRYHDDINVFLNSCLSTWLVYEDYYEKGKDTSGELVTTNYGTSVETTMSYGPYRMESYQPEKQVVFVQNENWYGYEKQEDGSLVSYTNFEVDGKTVLQYQTTKIIIDVMDPATAKQAFLKGELSDWEPTADDLLNYTTSEQLYRADLTYTSSLFFNTNLDALKEMDKSKGNKNSVVLSNIDFRKAFSLSIDRGEYVTATPGHKPAYALMGNLYFYDIYNDPTSSYRSSEPAMQAVCDLYGIEYGEGKAYETLEEAYKSVNGYNLTEAKALMKKACDQLVADKLYKAGEEIKIRIAYSSAALTSPQNKRLEMLNKYINAAAEDSGFGKIVLEGVGNIPDPFGDVPKGEYAIGAGAWGGAAFYPFSFLQVYCDNEQYQINEGACWQPDKEKLTLNVEGKDVTMTWKDWSNALIGSGPFATADYTTKLKITAKLEENFLKKYYRIPLDTQTNCTMLSFQCSNYTQNYNIMYGFGELRLLSYNFTDKEWADFVAEQNGMLKYE
ncbi:ABC transporter substrate-binding protein [Acetivibrio ethanolgignens]|uniref:Solute-binding protein family 5 domain-containing protein n=1 Tax=Acetivibrio ethanolgignens TaxID=290052 RepID=A0A0V8QET7_9FIRM|nr:ABC transporter substrate-binding protein [Acetivibrio ethanolgignens]KSV58899.1 hypothetical protein ASU35_11140 [Acetivibrio ethanolgignens]